MSKLYNNNMLANKKFLMTIVSCNRMLYLQNCIKSIQEFAWSPNEVKYLIIDLCTIENNILSYLEKLKIYGFNYFHFKKRFKNELYIGMNYAIDYAKKNDIPYIYFIQDDQQFVWKDANHFKKIYNIFENNSDVFYIQSSLVRRNRIYNTFDLKPTQRNGINYYKINLHYQDFGIFKTKLFNIIGKYPNAINTHTHMNKDNTIHTLCGEHWMRNHININYPEFSMVRLCDTNLAMIPDFCVVRGPWRYGHYININPSSDYYIEPFCQKKIQILHSNKLNIFEEDLIKVNVNLKSMEINTKIRTRLNDVSGYPKNLYGSFPFVPKELRKSLQFEIKWDINKNRYNIKTVPDSEII